MLPEAPIPSHSVRTGVTARQDLAPPDVSIAVTEPSEVDEDRYSFIVELDPGCDPLLPGLKMSALEVYYGLRYGSFNLGTVLSAAWNNERHTVIQGVKYLELDPPEPRIIKLVRLMLKQTT